MTTQNFNYKTGGNVTDSLIDISKTLESIKGQRFSLEKEIENEELYKDKLFDKLKSYQNELARINGNLNFLY
jgi:hypothetical protein